MLKVFVSQPMKGKTKEEILKEKELAIQDIKKLFDEDNIEVIDSYFEDFEPDTHPLVYLARSIELLA